MSCMFVHGKRSYIIVVLSHGYMYILAGVDKHMLNISSLHGMYICVCAAVRAGVCFYPIVPATVLQYRVISLMSCLSQSILHA